MATGINATYQATTSYTGAGLGSGGVPLIADTQQSTPANTNAPPATAAQLGAGWNAILVPTGCTVSRAMLLPPPGSTNVKILAGNTTDTGFGNWTTGSMSVPCSPGGAIYVNSTGAGEILTVAWS